MWLRRVVGALLSRENLLAVALCVMIVLLVVLTADTAPQWIYQGF
jgi:hypothetical protein